jgi:hypothetical protein
VITSTRFDVCVCVFVWMRSIACCNKVPTPESEESET